MLKKSIRKANTRFRDSYLKICGLKDSDNWLGIYLKDLDDLKMIFENVTQEVVNFFDDCFYHTHFCTGVKSLDFKKDDKFFVHN